MWLLWRGKTLVKNNGFTFEVVNIEHDASVRDPLVRNGSSVTHLFW